MLPAPSGPRALSFLLPAFALACLALTSSAAGTGLPSGVSPQWLENAKRAAIAARDGKVAGASGLTAEPAVIANLSPVADWQREGFEGFGYFARSLSTIGDVNGDGYSDVAIGGWQEDGGTPSLPGDAGKVYVWYGGSGGLPTSNFPPSNWVAHGNLSGHYFGFSVSAAGDVNGDGYGDMIAGAPGAGSGQNASVFLGSATGMALPNNTSSFSANWNCRGQGTYNGNSEFGACVSTAGDINGDGYDDVIVGAPSWSVSSASPGNGQVRVWLGRADFGATALGTSDDGTPANSAFSFSGANAGDAVGYSVATAGDVNGDGFDDVIVGAPNYGSLTGHVYLFTGNSSATPLTLTQDINSVGTGAQTGYSVATAGDLNGDGYSDVVIGSPGASGGKGAVTIFLGSANGSPLSFYTTIFGATAGDNLGASVATAGDVNGDGYADIVVGATQYSDLTNTPGYAQMYYGGPGGLRSLTPVWTSIGLLSTPHNHGSAYGRCVATAGDVDGDGFSDVLVGASSYGVSDWGKAYLFRGAPDPPTQQAWAPIGGTDDDLLGWSAAFAGDINGDGFGDVLVGAPHMDFAYTDQGAMFVYLGTANGLPAASSQTLVGGVGYGQFGISVAGAGDLNNDGYADVIVGAHTFFIAGAAFIYYGGPGGLPTSGPQWSTLGNTTNGYYGACVAGVGDLNGDGFADVAVGAPYENGPGVEQGRVAIYLGAPGILSTTPARELYGEQPGDHFGNALAWAGDVNRDGLSDLLIGAPGTDLAGTDAGSAYVFKGSNSQAVEAAYLWKHDGRAAGAAFGGAVAHAGDVNNDGYSDILIGAVGDAPGGRVEAYYGSPTGPPTTPSWSESSAQAFSGFGASLSTSGDVNNDGYSDILVGAVFFDGPNGSDCGRASVYLGGPGGISNTPYWSIDGPHAQANVGHAVAGGGDINGDGFSDLLFGIPGYYLGGAYRGGLAWAALGNAATSGATVRSIGQLKNCFHCTLSPIQPMGFASGFGYFMQMRNKSAKGRDRARLRTDVAGSSQLLTGPGSLSGYVDTGLGQFTNIMSGTCSGALNPCHWRIRLESHSPYFPATPWYTLAGNARNESDVRMAATVLATEYTAPPSTLALAILGANPSHDETRLMFDLPRAGVAQIVVRDVQGRNVRTVMSGWRPAGRYMIVWDANDEHGASAATGVYFIDLSLGSERQTRKVTLTR